MPKFKHFLIWKEILDFVQIKSRKKNTIHKIDLNMFENKNNHTQTIMYSNNKW